MAGLIGTRVLLGIFESCWGFARFWSLTAQSAALDLIQGLKICDKRFTVLAYLLLVRLWSIVRWEDVQNVDRFSSNYLLSRLVAFWLGALACLNQQIESKMVLS